MKYQTLVNECKKAFKSNDLKGAYKYWCDIHDILDKKLDKIDRYDDNSRYKCYQEFHDYMEQFSDDEVYTICDYGKRIEYAKMGYYY